MKFKQKITVTKFSAAIRLSKVALKLPAAVTQVLTNIPCPPHDRRQCMLFGRFRLIIHGDHYQTEYKQICFVFKQTERLWETKNNFYPGGQNSWLYTTFKHIVAVQSVIHVWTTSDFSAGLLPTKVGCMCAHFLSWMSLRPDAGSGPFPCWGPYITS